MRTESAREASGASRTVELSRLPSVLVQDQLVLNSLSAFTTTFDPWLASMQRRGIVEDGLLLTLLMRLQLVEGSILTALAKGMRWKLLATVAASIQPPGKCRVLLHS